jgi:predicted RNA-binding protein Jag
MLSALEAPLNVTENGKSRRKAKVVVSVTQIANQGAAGDLRAAKMAVDIARKSADRVAADKATRAPPMTEADHEIVERVIARIRAVTGNEGGEGC